MNFHHRQLGKSNFLEFMKAYTEMCKTFKKDGNKLGKRKRELLMAELRDTKTHDDLINSFCIIDDPIKELNAKIYNLMKIPPSYFNNLSETGISAVEIKNAREYKI